MRRHIYLIGGNGVVGSAVHRWFLKRGEQVDVIQRNNKQDFLGTSCDLLINCNGNAQKGKANADPWFDFDASVRSVAEYTLNITANLTVLMSTVDVYPDPIAHELTKEDLPIDRSRQSPYGFHKLIAEDIVRRFSRHYLILRLPGLAGPGLKKNPLFDFMTADKMVLIAPQSRLNFIHTDVVASLLADLIGKDICDETLNIVARDSIALSELEAITGQTSKWAPDSEKNTQTYLINSDKAQKLLSLPTSADCVRMYMQDLAKERQSHSQAPPMTVLDCLHNTQPAVDL